MMRAKRSVMNAWRTVAIAVVALSALSGASAQFPNLVQDPSFETTISDNNYGFPPTTWSVGQSFGSTTTGDTDPNTPDEDKEVWVVTSGSIDLVNGPNFGHPNGGGDQFVELNGNEPGAIRQRVEVSEGGFYNFSFYYGGYAAWIDDNGNQQDADPDYELFLRARIVDNLGSVIYSAVVSWSIARGGFNGSWIPDPYTDQVELDPGTYYVVFESLHSGGTDRNGNYIPDYFGPRIDGVNLSLVPEPASMVALGAGLTGLLGLRRRRAQG
jgi:hypothetical protein